MCMGNAPFLIFIVHGRGENVQWLYGNRKFLQIFLENVPGRIYKYFVSLQQKSYWLSGCFPPEGTTENSRNKMQSVPKQDKDKVLYTNLNININ